MMTELEKTSDLLRGMVNAIKIPVTAKMRLGWDNDNLTAPDLAPRAGRCRRGRRVCPRPHPRPRLQRAMSNLAGIRSVAAAVKSIPVIGNGDVTTPEAVKEMLNVTGCAGVSIGRGALLRSLDFPTCGGVPGHGHAGPPSLIFAERIRVMRPAFRALLRLLRRGARGPAFSAKSPRGTPSALVPLSRSNRGS